MLVNIIALGLLGLVVAALLWAMRAAQLTSTNRFEHDFALLKQEQAALEAQLAAGDVSDADADRLRNELRRRALHLKRLSEGIPELHDRPVPAAWMFAGLILCLGFALYLITRDDMPTRAPNDGAAVDVTRANLPQTATFDDLMALGQQRFAQGNHAGAFDAYEAASALAPGRVEGWLAQGEALVAAENGEISPAAMLTFARAERLSPGNPVSQYYSGLERLQQGDAAAAQAIWQSLKARSRPTAPWMPQLERGLIAAARALGQDSAPQIGQEQIAGMVAGLAARLEEEPDDPQGWLMLARSYLVLGRPDDAARALNSLDALPDVEGEIAAEAAQLRARLGAQ